jgi:hypothetical protein
MLLFATFFILCIGLLIVVYIRARRIVAPDAGVKEGFNPMRILKAFSKFGKTIKQFTGRFKHLKTAFAGMGPAFTTMFKNVGIMSAGVFTNSFQYTAALGTYAFAWVNCMSEKMKNIKTCFPFYLLDMFLYFCYISLMSVCFLLDVILQLKRILGISLVTSMIDGLAQIKEADAMIYSYSGIHFFGYPEIIINTCYRCKKPPNKNGMRRAKYNFDYNNKVKYPEKGREIGRRFKIVGRGFKKFFS